LIVFQSKTIRISGQLAIILSIVAIAWCFFYVFISIRFPKFFDGGFLTQLMWVILIFLIVFATMGIPATIFAKTRMGKLSFIIMFIIIGIITFVLAYYFLHSKPNLYDFLENKLTVSFFLYIPFLFFSFLFLVFSNAMLWRFGSYSVNIRKPRTMQWAYIVIILIFYSSRFIFPLACFFLHQPLIGGIRVFLISVLKVR